MKRPILFLMLVILLAGGAIGAMSTFSQAQVYAPPPPRPVAVTPWVGNNTPWTFYKGDWFMNGILYYFFGPRYGFAPYYAYSQVYIVRPNNWYAPGWNSWYQGHPEYWNNFERQHPEWRGHQIGRHYDQNFYNRYHRGQGGGWNQGFQGVRPQGTTGHGISSQGTTGHGFSPQGTTGRGFTPQGTTGHGISSQGTTGHGGHPLVTSPGGRPSGTAGTGGHGPVTTSPGGHPAVTGTGGHPSGAGSSGGTPGKTPPHQP